MFEMIIVMLTVLWLLCFFGQTLIPRLLHSGNFIYMLSVLIVFLIIVRFQS